ncbi:putative tansposase [Escherichia coli]|nr:putative tansposase [Escherichia coli]CAD5791051.1 putative tansposase [Escherichia coli]CAD5791196.1 putative tansposase [Escherichia coli]CAD6083129.1 putative tansposase [Escherichia coli]CAD6085260.1 putative tansposase [Escherichia coli]
MRKARFTEHQIIAVIKSVEAGRTVKDVCREAGISEATYYIYGLPPFCKYRIWFWVVAYIYPASGKLTCAQMGNPHTIASTTGRPLRPI